MHLESSQGQEGQEPLKLSTQTETSHSSVVQEENGRGKLSANAFLGSDQEVVPEQALQNPATLNDEGMEAFDRYLANQQVADLTQAIKCWHDALILTPFNAPNYTLYWCNLGMGLFEGYMLTNTLEYLEPAIHSLQSHIQDLPPEIPDRSRYLKYLGAALFMRYDRHNRSLEDLDASIDAFQQFIQATPVDVPERVSLQRALGGILLQRYKRVGQLEDLDASITACQQFIQATPVDVSERVSCQRMLGVGLLDRYHHIGLLEDLETGIGILQQAIQAPPPNASELARCLGCLGAGLLDRYARLGALKDLEDSISSLRQAVQIMPDESDRLIYLRNLGRGLLIRYEHAGAPEDLDASITACQQAAQTTLSDPSEHAFTLDSLGGGLRSRYMRTGRLEDLESSINAFQQAIQVAPIGTPYQPLYLGSLGMVLLDRYARTGLLEDLETGISTLQQALQLTQTNAANRSDLLNNLGLGLLTRYTRMGLLEDLDASISTLQQAIQAMPPDAPRQVIYLNNLGLGLRSRYARTGLLEDLESSIHVLQQAVQDMSSNVPHLAVCLNNLGLGLFDRYARTGLLEDLEAAISTFRQAVQATSSDAPNQALCLSNLGGGLFVRYTRTEALEDLEAAISTFRQAVQATSSDAPNQAFCLSNLGGGLFTRYERVGGLEDLEAAMSVSQQAIQNMPDDAPDRLICLANLGFGMRARYERTKALGDLKSSIRAFQQAIQATPVDAPIRANCLGHLGEALYECYARTKASKDLRAATAAWESSWSVPQFQFTTLPVVYQLGQQRQGVDITTSLVGAYLKRISQSYFRAYRTLRRALEVTEGSKSRLLTRLVGRGSLPIPAGFTSQNADREQQLLTQLTILDTQELALFNQTTFLEKEIDHLSRLQQRQTILRELDDLWTSLLHLGPEGAAYVALHRGDTPTWQEFAHWVKELGSATVLLSFFTTDDCALLFLLRAGWRAPRIVEVPLDQAGWADLMERFSREVHYHTPSQRRGETWEKPLHTLLTKAQQHLAGAERLILAPQGDGHLLPWGVLAEHAGWHTSAGQPMSLVTLPALGILPRLRHHPRVRTDTGLALVVGNPRGDLPYAEVEANEVAKRFGTHPLLGTDATKSEVLARLPEATLIHLATHANFDPKDPLESGIKLADDEVLTAREILQRPLQADLLVLSACESGKVGPLGGEELAGLSQAFLQAGVRSLLVSLWQVNDPATAALIQAFYAVWQAGADKALALRQAMTQIQQNPHWTHPYYWGAFVLMGDWN